MQKWVKEWAKTQQFLKRIPFFANSIEEIHDIVNTNYPNLKNVVIERNTTNGFFMRLHRDDYYVNHYKFKEGIRDDSLWKPIYNIERPIITVLWYRSTQGIDFSGGNLRFHDGYIVRPEKNSAILFDSNEPHEVTLQTKNCDTGDERKVVIIKYY